MITDLRSFSYTGFAFDAIVLISLLRHTTPPTGFTIMTPPALVCLLALTMTIWAGDAFVIPRSAHRSAFAVSAVSPAEEHLEEMSESWNKLKEKEKEVERTQDEVS